jgi:hypothetical protein
VLGAVIDAVVEILKLKKHLTVDETTEYGERITEKGKVFFFLSSPRFIPQ